MGKSKKTKRAVTSKLDKTPSPQKAQFNADEGIDGPRGSLNTSMNKENSNGTDSESDSFSVESPFSPLLKRLDKATRNCSTPKSMTDNDDSQDEIGSIYWDCFSPRNKRHLIKIKGKEDNKNITELVKQLLPNKHHSPISGKRLIVPSAKPSQSKRLERQKQKEILKKKRREELLKECEFIEKEFLRNKGKNEQNVCQISAENNVEDNKELWPDEDYYENDSFVQQATQVVDSCSTSITSHSRICKNKDEVQQTVSTEENNDLWSDDSFFQNDSFLEKATQVVDSCSENYTNNTSDKLTASSDNCVNKKSLNEKRTKQVINRNRAIALRKRSESLKKRKLKFS